MAAAIRSMKQYLSLVETRVKDAETIPESDEPKFKPGAKVLIQSPKTKHWDQSAIVINWRHGRTYVLDDGTQRFTRRALRPNDGTRTNSSPI